MQKNLLPGRHYSFLFLLLGVVYIIGLFVPLMDNDSAHHADIGLRMFLTGDYVNMIDHRGDYIDKPHFLFWVSALSYHIFGVTGFAYKFPSFIFTILGTYSVYRLAKELYDQETGKLASLIYATSFCVVLANNDVRMDAILAASIAFATWQLVAFVHHRRNIFLLGSALGLAVGFATKGHVGLATPVVGLFFYILYKQQWRLLIDWHWLVVVVLFALFISPVVYCYYLQFNLYPEKISQGMKGVNGVKYILWSHSFDRISGHERFGGSLGAEDKFFFLHTFLWTFAPWCFVGFVAVFIRLKNLFKRNEEWLSTGVFLLLAALINFSNFKLPHYLPILAPATSLIVAHFFIKIRSNEKNVYVFYGIQIFASLLLIAAAFLVNFWAFPVTKSIVFAGIIIFLAVVFYYLISGLLNKLQKAIAVSVASLFFFFFLLNSNFYPQLLAYQGGKPLAGLTQGVADPKNVFFWKNTFSSSYVFYSSSIRKVYDDSLLNKKSFWLIYEKSQQSEIDSAGLLTGKTFSVPDYEITRLKKSFINPKTRSSVLDSLVMSEIIGKKQ